MEHLPSAFDGLGGHHRRALRYQNRALVVHINGIPFRGLGERDVLVGSLPCPRRGRAFDEGYDGSSVLGLLRRRSRWRFLVSELYDRPFLFGAHRRAPDDHVPAIKLDALDGEPLQQRPLRAGIPPPRCI